LPLVGRRHVKPCVRVFEEKGKKGTLLKEALRKDYLFTLELMPV